MKKLLTTLLTGISLAAAAQKTDSIYFNLYTDSLKKGVYNYINVDGRLSNGTFTPLMDDEVTFKSSAGAWHGNSLVLDTSIHDEKVMITATLKNNPAISKTIFVYIKKVNTDPILRSEKEVMDGYRRKRG